MDEGFKGSMGQLAVELVPFGPKTKHKNESLVRFKTMEARDVVRSGN